MSIGRSMMGSLKMIIRKDLGLFIYRMERSLPGLFKKILLMDQERSFHLIGHQLIVFGSQINYKFEIKIIFIFFYIIFLFCFCCFFFLEIVNKNKNYFFQIFFFF